MSYSYLFHRIERLWRDVREKVIQFYIILFAEYEREGFDIGNVWHVFTLQYMFMNRIQEELNDFKQFWNNHPIRTENNRSPIQLMILRYNDINFDEPIDYENYGIDSDDDLDDEDEDNQQVVCDPIRCPLSDANFVELKRRISPLNSNIPVSELTNRFQTALEIVLDYRDTQ